MNDNGLEQDWDKVLNFFRERFTGGETPSVDTILYLIGVQELGRGFRRFSKDEKLNLMHIAVCRLLEPYGIYEQTGRDADGWPVFEQKKSLPAGADKERLFKEAIIRYFKENDLI